MGFAVRFISGAQCMAKTNAQQIGCLPCVFFTHGELFYPTIC
jgi:hypothetical protein